MVCSSLSTQKVQDSIPISPQRLERLDSADYYITNNKWQDAERTLKDALRLEPASRQNAMLLANLGMVQTELGLFNDALQSYSAGLCITPSSTLLLTNRGTLFMQLHRFNDAITDFSKALQSDSTLIRPRLLRALSLISLSNYNAAEPDLRLYLENKSNDDYALALLAQCCEMRADREEAEKLLDKAISLRKDPQYYFDLSRMLILDENYDTARDKILDGIQSFPEAGMLYLLRGYIHNKKYRHSEAAADREIAIRKGVDKMIAEAWIPL
ncbi:MAG: tetratricopeptide repeat protein [Prevotella sp.]|nr:tetratricopeptide repeat protein [Prevotella sp.]MCM1436542.1 tetratricopeptide repeat protein [Prevotella sp.]